MFASSPVSSIADIRRLVIEGGRERIRPCLMTTATTVLALLPVLTSRGRGADVMIPMALPVVGGMTIELVTLYITPVCYCWLKEFLWRRGLTQGHFLVDTGSDGPRGTPGSALAPGGDADPPTGPGDVLTAS